MRIFGSPVTVPVSATREMLVARKYGAFAMPEEEQKQLWASALPSSGPQVDVVLTHGPPQGILDQMFHGKHVGLAKKWNQTLFLFKGRWKEVPTS